MSIDDVLGTSDRVITDNAASHLVFFFFFGGGGGAGSGVVTMSGNMPAIPELPFVSVSKRVYVRNQCVLFVSSFSCKSNSFLREDSF